MWSPAGPRLPASTPRAALHRRQGSPGTRAQNATAPLALPVPSPEFSFSDPVVMRGDLLVVRASGFSTLPLFLKSRVLNFTCLRAEMSFFTCVDET